MIKLQPLAQLTIKDAPCLEYPGYYILHFGNTSQASFTFKTLEPAIAFAKDQAKKYISGSIWWHASNNDPRIGEKWFKTTYEAYKW